MKKAISVIFCLIMIFTMFGCKAKPSSSLISSSVSESDTASTPASSESGSTEPGISETDTSSSDQNPSSVSLPSSIKVPGFTKTNYPRIDGSTANIPLAQLLAKRILGMRDEETENFISFNTTPNSYINLMEKKCDLLLVYEASESTKQQLKNGGANFEYFPIGRDALVFIANQQNPVKSLTNQQLLDIYTGKITNWNQVGGVDAKIEAFQRQESSGSQALMDKLVMKGTKMMNAPTEKRPGEMSGLIDALAEYNNSGNAIGYSVYYYASLMYTKPGLKFIGVNGVMPSNITIKSKEYPYTNDFFAVIRKSEGKNSPARQLAEWLTTLDGKALIEQAGYVAS